MNFNFIPDRFKPTRKKLIWSIIIAIIIDFLYWLIISSTTLSDIIKPFIDNIITPIIDWYTENIVTMLFSISGIIIILIIFIIIYIVASLIQKKNKTPLKK